MSVADFVDPRTPEAVLAYCLPGGMAAREAAERNIHRWFDVDPAFDAELLERLGDTAAEAASGALDHWGESARGALALMLLLDQVPRNIWRRTPRAFASDLKAQALSLATLERGLHEELVLLEQVFFFMAFEHAEDPALQARCVAGYEALHAAAPAALRELTALFVQAGRDHQAVIKRFGRFPHRNAILGRESSAEEVLWCEQNGHAWGQGHAVDTVTGV